MEYVKVSKPIARKMYNSGLTVNLLPCKVSTCSVWIRPSQSTKPNPKTWKISLIEQ